MVSIPFLAGCSVVGPDFAGVSPPGLGNQFIAEPTQQRDSEMLARYWQLLDDPVLNRLLEISEKNSPTLQKAFFKVKENRARAGIAGANLKPSVDVSGQFGLNKRSESADPFVAQNADTFNLTNVGLDTRWEIDLFGKLRRARESAVADLSASAFDHDFVRLSLMADVARTYVDVRVLQEQISLARQSLEVQKMTIGLVGERADAGVSTELDASQARSFQHRTEAQLVELEQLLEIAFNQLAFLTGEAPTMELRTIVGAGPVPLASTSSIGFPADVLRFRPDLKSAESRVHSACALIGVAQAEYYPQIVMGGTINLQSKSLSDLFTSESLALALGPSFRWNILSFGRIGCSVEAARAAMNQAIAEYRETAINAVREVEDSLVSQQKQRLRSEVLRQAIVADEQAVELSMERYKVGKANFQRVLDAQQQLLQDLQLEVESRGNATIEFIRTLKSVGAGWAPVNNHIQGVPNCVVVEQANAVTASNSFARPGTIPVPQFQRPANLEVVNRPSHQVPRLPRMQTPPPAQQHSVAQQVRQAVVQPASPSVAQYDSQGRSGEPQAFATAPRQNSAHAHKITPRDKVPLIYR